jgi:hypothetical protein
MLTSPCAFNHALLRACCKAGVLAMCQELCLLTPCLIAVMRLTPRATKFLIFVRGHKPLFPVAHADAPSNPVLQVGNWPVVFAIDYWLMP